MEQVTINKEAFVELMKLKEEFDLIMESIELMNDKEFMKSYKQAKEEIKKGELIDFDEL